MTHPLYDTNNIFAKTQFKDEAYNMRGHTSRKSISNLGQDDYVYIYMNITGIKGSR